MQEENFFHKVYREVSKIPYGQVATYGQIAAILGSPRAARQVGFALRSLGLNEQKVPWWRVINSKGYLSINHGDGGVEKDVQKDLLLAEGIEVDEKYNVDLVKFIWRGEI